MLPWFVFLSFHISQIIPFLISVKLYAMKHSGNVVKSAQGYTESKIKLSHMASVWKTGLGRGGEERKKAIGSVEGEQINLKRWERKRAKD